MSYRISYVQVNLLLNIKASLHFHGFGVELCSRDHWVLLVLVLSVLREILFGEVVGESWCAHFSFLWCNIFLAY